LQKQLAEANYSAWLCNAVEKEIEQRKARAAKAGR
jgi:hypothetical protein